jgi:hypothetical protein
MITDIQSFQQVIKFNCMIHGHQVSALSCPSPRNARFIKQKEMRQGGADLKLLWERTMQDMNWRRKSETTRNLLVMMISTRTVLKLSSWNQFVSVELAPYFWDYVKCCPPKSGPIYIFGSLMSCWGFSLCPIGNDCCFLQDKCCVQLAQENIN